MRDRRFEYSSVAKTVVKNQADADAQSQVKLQENENLRDKTAVQFLDMKSVECLSPTLIC